MEGLSEERKGGNRTERFARIFNLLIRTLLLRVQDTEAGDGREEHDGAAGAGGDHVVGAGLGDEEGACEVDVEEVAELARVVGFGSDVGAFCVVCFINMEI